MKLKTALFLLKENIDSLFYNCLFERVEDKIIAEFIDYIDSFPLKDSKTIKENIKKHLIFKNLKVINVKNKLK